MALPEQPLVSAGQKKVVFAIEFQVWVRLASDGVKLVHDSPMNSEQSSFFAIKIEVILLQALYAIFILR